MERKSKGHLTTANTRQVHNCKVTDSQCNLQENWAKSMNVVLSEVSEQAICPRTGEKSLMFIISKMRGGEYGA